MDRLENATGLYPIAYPFAEFTKPSDGSPYTELQIVPNDTRDVWCGTIKSGNILLNTSYSKGSGIEIPTAESEKYLDLFNEGLVFDGVTIPDEGTIINAVSDREDNGRYFVPTIIKFEAR